VIQGALVALRASGHRLASSVPGHHHTLLQTLAVTIGADDAELRLLDTIRRRRNANDYAGRPVEHALAEECLLRAQRLTGRVQVWLRAKHPALLG
jgi:hypothetical protein